MLASNSDVTVHCCTSMARTVDNWLTLSPATRMRMKMQPSADRDAIAGVNP
jgi:hypothetical protein